MNKALLIVSVVLSLLVIALVSGFTVMTNRQKVSVISSKGLDEDGVLLITPVDPRFAMAVTEMSGPGNDAIMEAAGPFGVVIQNETANDIVGCSIKWELMRSDGTVTTLHQEYNNPGALLGMEPADPNMVGKTAVINAKSNGFLALDSGLKNLFYSKDSRHPMSDADHQRLAKLSDVTQRNLRNVVAVNISLDGVIFATGEFIGPDTNHFLKRVQALVTAKKDVVGIVNKKMAEKADASNIVEDLVSKKNSPFVLGNTGDAEFDRAHDAYFKRFVEELVRMRTVNDDQFIIKSVRHGSDKIREVHRKQKKA